jgi:hypothetical protein
MIPSSVFAPLLMQKKILVLCQGNSMTSNDCKFQCILEADHAAYQTSELEELIFDVEASFM